MSTRLDKVLYTAKAHTTGGREGRSVSDDGLLDVRLAPPKALGGMGGATNPEQLFAAGYSRSRPTLPSTPVWTLAPLRRALASLCAWTSTCPAWTARWPRP